MQTSSSVRSLDFDVSQSQVGFHSAVWCVLESVLITLAHSSLLTQSPHTDTFQQAPQYCTGAQLPALPFGSIGRLEGDGLLELEASLHRDVDRTGKGAGVLVRSHSLDDRERANEGVMAAVETAGRPFERGPESHEPLRVDFSLGVLRLVELDDQAAQGFVDGHFAYNQDE